MSDYDEDLELNPLFVCLRSDHPEVFERAKAEGFLVALPRRVCLLGIESFEKRHILRHLLIANEDIVLTRYHTADGLSVALKGHNLEVAETDTTRAINTRILFTETYYDDDMQKVQLCCLESPLGLIQEVEETNDVVDHGQGHEPGLITVSASVSESTDFLKKFVGGSQLLRKIDRFVRDFERTTISSMQFNRPAVEDDVKILPGLIVKLSAAYKDAVNVALAFPHVKVNSSWHATIAIAVESYFMHCAHESILKLLSHLYSRDDATFNLYSKLATNSGLNPASLDIKDNFLPLLPKARNELLYVMDATSPRSKIECLNRCFETILSDNNNMSSKLAVSADDLLPILIFTLTKMDVANWTAQLRFMADFRLANLNKLDSPRNSSDKTSFQLATLEAAIEHIKVGGIRKDFSSSLDYLEIQESQENELTIEGQLLFEAVANNDVETSRKLLASKKKYEIPFSNSFYEETTICHPLCMCAKCSERKSHLKISMNPLHQTNGLGWTPLHFATRLGRPLLVDLFLSMDQYCVNCRDNQGQTPLHVAATFGQQNALLLLLHANADFNIPDNAGNSPLILASQNGHTPCVKALLYFAEHQSRFLRIDAQNSAGYTALHCASRWGFFDIVNILMEHGANPDTRSKKRESPLMTSHNPYIAHLLNHSSVQTRFSSMVTDINSNFTEDEKNLTRIFKAIHTGDVRLVAYFLGLDGFPTNGFESLFQIEVGCQPFCDCVKCSMPITSDQPALPLLARQGKVPIFMTRKMHRKSRVNSIDGHGKTFLHAAASVGNLQIINLLLKAGAVPLSDIYGSTPLHAACLEGHLPVVELLLSKFPDICNTQDNSGATPLHLCVDTGNYEIASLLLRRGALFNLKNKAGQSAMAEARYRKDLAILDLFLKHELKRKQSLEDSVSKLSFSGELDYCEEAI